MFARIFNTSLFLVFGIAVLFLEVPAHVAADQFTSSSYRVEAPEFGVSSYATSSGFQVWSTIGGLGIGTSTITNFSLNSGFLTFPWVSTPSVSATAGDAQVALSWSASEGFLGWSVGGYDVGQSSVSGGPYTYASVGNVLSSTRTGLTNGTAYYFVVLPKDASGVRIATSTEFSGTPVATPSSSSSSSSGGGGGGGGGGSSPLSISFGTVNFSGRTYPKSTVTILKDAQIVSSAVSGSDGTFGTSVGSLSPGKYVFSLYSEDRNGVLSSTHSFPTSIASGVTVNLTGIFIAPTISVDKGEVKKGDEIVFFGQASPRADVVIAVNSEEEYFARITTDTDGIYLYQFDSTVLDYGLHSARSKAVLLSQLVSTFSVPVEFRVGTKNVLAPKKLTQRKGDLNGDKRINLIDFSIAAYWYKRKLFGPIIELERQMFNGDGKIDLRDFSVLAFNWTG